MNAYDFKYLVVNISDNLGVQLFNNALMDLVKIILDILNIYVKILMIHKVLIKNVVKWYMNVLII